MQSFQLSGQIFQRITEILKEVSFRPPLYQSHRLTAVAFPLQCLYSDSYRFQILRVGEGKQEACIHQHGTGEYFIADAVHGLRIKTSEAYMEVLRVSMGQSANRYQDRSLPVLAYRKAAACIGSVHQAVEVTVLYDRTEVLICLYLIPDDTLFHIAELCRIKLETIGPDHGN